MNTNKHEFYLTRIKQMESDIFYGNFIKLSLISSALLQINHALSQGFSFV